MQVVIVSETLLCRALFRAYDENNGKARESVLKAIKTAADKLNARAKA